MTFQESFPQVVENFVGNFRKKKNAQNLKIRFIKNRVLLDKYETFLNRL